MDSNIPRHYKSADARARNATSIEFTDVELDPYNGTSFNNTNKRKIKFRLPRVGTLNGQKSGLKADVHVSGGSSDCLVSHFDKFRLWIGSTLVVDETQDWGRYKVLELDAYSMSDEVNSATLKKTGYRIVNADSTTITKWMPLTHPKYNKRGFFAKKWPLFKMNQVFVEYELYSDLNQFTSGDATAITVDNVKLKLELLDGEAIREEYKEEIKMTFLSQEKHSRQIVNNQTKINEIIPAAQNNINFLIIEQKDSTLVDLGITGQNYNFTSNHTLNSIDNVEVFIDGQRFPKQQIQTEGANDITEIVDNMEKSWLPNSKYLGDVVHNYSNKTDEGNMYVMVPLSAELKAISGKKLSNKSGSIVLKADINATQATDLDVWVNYNRFVKISSSGAISVLE